MIIAKEGHIMAEEEKKEVIEAEVEEKEKEEKKESKFSSWFKKTKQDISDGILESKIESFWNGEHTQFDIYIHNGNILTGQSVYGSIEGDTLTYFGKAAIQANSVVVDKKTKKAYYAKDSKPTSVGIDYNGFHYDRDGTEIVLDENVTEVKVIKAGDRYFLYKGE